MTTDKTPVLENQGYAEVKVLAYGREYKFTIIIPYGNADASLEIPISYTTESDPTAGAISVDDILVAWEGQLQSAGFDTIICGNGIYFTPNATANFKDLVITTAGEGYSVDAATTTWDDAGTPTDGPSIEITVVGDNGEIEVSLFLL